jgi:acyl-coenzyme A synthetase/AMP-(fatty) acid ligase
MDMLPLGPLLVGATSLVFEGVPTYPDAGERFTPF